MGQKAGDCIPQPDEQAVARMLRLLDAFSEQRTIRKPLGFTINGQESYREEHEAVGEFARLAYRDGWVLPGVHGIQPEKPVDDSVSFTGADMVMLRRLMTKMIRNEHYREGSLQDAYQRGELQSLLKRLKMLHEGTKVEIAD